MTDRYDAALADHQSELAIALTEINKLKAEIEVWRGYMDNVHWILGQDLNDESMETLRRYVKRKVDDGK